MYNLTSDYSGVPLVIEMIRLYAIRSRSGKKRDRVGLLGCSDVEYWLL